MKYNFIVVILLMFQSLQAQELKKFTGDFYDGAPDAGKATYTYYEKDDARVKHGAFSYSKNLKSDDGSFQKLIQGGFNNNNKDGNWSYSINLSDWDNGLGIYLTGVITLTSNYIAGMPNGQWTYNSRLKNRTKSRSISGFQWSVYSDEEIEKAIVNFKNGKLNSNLSIENCLYTDNIKAVFDDKGFCINTMTISDSPIKVTETVFDYYKNTVIKYVVRNTSTGEVIGRMTNTADEISILKRYSDEEISLTDLRAHFFDIDTIKVVPNLTSSIFNTDFFLYDYIKGDKVYDNELDYGGYHLLTTKHNQIKLSEINEMEWIDDYADKTLNLNIISESIDRIENVRIKYKNNLSSDDRSLLSLEMQKWQKAQAELNFIIEKRKQRISDWYEINSELSDAMNDTLKLQQVLKRLLDYKSINQVYLTDRNKELIDYNSLEKYTKASNDKELVDEKIKYIERELLALIARIEREKKAVGLAEEKRIEMELEKRHDDNTTAIYGYYGQYGRGGKIKTVEDVYLIRDIGNNVVKIKKKNLYSAFEVVKDDLGTKRTLSKDNKQIAIEIGNVLISLCDKMIVLLEQETDELEKLLKKEQNPQKIMEILGLDYPAIKQ